MHLWTLPQKYFDFPLIWNFISITNKFQYIQFSQSNLQAKIFFSMLIVFFYSYRASSSILMKIIEKVPGMELLLP